MPDPDAVQCTGASRRSSLSRRRAAVSRSAAAFPHDGSTSSPHVRSSSSRGAWIPFVLLLAAAVAAPGCVQREAVVMSRDVVTGTGAREPTVQPVVRAGRNLPTSFEVVVLATVRTDCAPVLRDADMQTELTLHSSVLQAVRDSLGTHYRAVGDYAAEPRGRYGDDHPGDGLRIDCVRLRALGIVRLGSAGG